MDGVRKITTKMINIRVFCGLAIAEGLKMDSIAVSIKRSSRLSSRSAKRSAFALSKRFRCGEFDQRSDADEAYALLSRQNLRVSLGPGLQLQQYSLSKFETSPHPDQTLNVPNKSSVRPLEITEHLIGRLHPGDHCTRAAVNSS